MPAAYDPLKTLRPNARRKVEDRQLVAKTLGIVAHVLEERQRALFGDRGQMVPVQLIDTFRMTNLVSKIALTSDDEEAQQILDEVKARWTDKKDRPEGRP